MRYPAALLSVSLMILSCTKNEEISHARVAADVENSQRFQGTSTQDIFSLGWGECTSYNNVNAYGDGTPTRVLSDAGYLSFHTTEDRQRCQVELTDRVRPGEWATETAPNGFGEVFHIPTHTRKILEVIGIQSDEQGDGALGQFNYVLELTPYGKLLYENGALFGGASSTYCINDSYCEGDAVYEKRGDGWLLKSVGLADAKAKTF